jgi:hypothetical protein
MALLNLYDEDYLGIGDEKAQEPPPRKKRKRRTL